MTAVPPENPPAADFDLQLCAHYPPHGFPPYLGLGLLDTGSLRLVPGESVAEYREGDDLVYRVCGTFDPDRHGGDTSACAVGDASWEIEEFFADCPWRRTAGHRTLSQVFFHHLAEQLPTENPRVSALLRRLAREHLVAVRCQGVCTYAMFPAGYLHTIRLPLTDATLERVKAFLEEAPDALPVPWPAAEKPSSVVILKADRLFRTQFERGVVCDVTVPLVRLESTVRRLAAAGAVAGPVHLRPEVIYAHERAGKYARVHPGRLEDGVVTYQVVTIVDRTPPPRALEATFVADSLETFALVDAAWRAGPPAGLPA
jgi:hypothetical protein